MTNLEVEPAWSSQCKGAVPLAIDAAPSAEYLIFAFEMGAGFVPAQVALTQPPRARSSSSEWLKLGGVGTGEALFLILVTAPIWWPIQKLAQHRREQAARTDSGCFVWAEDSNSGEIIAGASPWPQLIVR